MIEITGRASTIGQIIGKLVGFIIKLTEGACLNHFEEEKEA